MFESRINHYSHVDDCASLPLDRLSITRPGGNDTALVWKAFPRDQQKSVADRIQKMLPGVEQVMFVEPGQKTKWRGQMAGGEFCGNATRSLGYMLLDGKPGSVDLEISGTDKIMTVTVTGDGAETSVPVNPDLSSVARISDTDFNVRLDGISFLVTEEGSAVARRIMDIENDKDQKDEVIKILSEHAFDGPASGIIIVTEQEGKPVAMDPFVYVRSTGTVYYETACGSGATAVGMVRAKLSGAPVHDLQLVQPSGMSLTVNIERDSQAFISASVGGPVDIVMDERLRLPKNSPLPCYKKAG